MTELAWLPRTRLQVRVAVPVAAAAQPMLVRRQWISDGCLEEGGACALAWWAQSRLGWQSGAGLD
eukprot:8732266-Alexandrium_andersonii.AAC.1